MAFELKFQSFPEDSGQILWAYVPWDSELFGFHCYELRFESITSAFVFQHLPNFLDSLPGNQNCLVCIKIPTTAVEITRALSNSGFYPVETLFELRLSIQKFTPAISRRFDHLHLRQAGEPDIPKLIEIAGNAFSTDRFHLDPNLPSERADQRYRQWVSHGYQMGESIFVLEDTRTNDMLGFLHTRTLSTKTVDLSLAAVLNHPKTSVFGLVLYQKALAELEKQGYQLAVTRISVNNLPIVNVLSRLGFAFTNANLTMHWFRDKESL